MAARQEFLLVKLERDLKRLQTESSSWYSEKDNICVLEKDRIVPIAKTIYFICHIHSKGHWIRINNEQ